MRYVLLCCGVICCAVLSCDDDVGLNATRTAHTDVCGAIDSIRLRLRRLQGQLQALPQTERKSSQGYLQEVYPVNHSIAQTRYSLYSFEQHLDRSELSAS